MVDVICFGELLIDFVSTEAGVTLEEAPVFKKAAGGAPANVAVGLARLGKSSGFMGKVGDDPFGRFLAATLEENGVDISHLLFEEHARTALAFVSLTGSGERDFLFYRHPSADMLIRREEIDAAYIGTARVFHFGSITLVSEPSRSAHLAALQHAEGHGLFVSYDPNLRLSLWPSAQVAREVIRSVWDCADLIKVSEEEGAFLAGERDLEKAAAKLWTPRLKLLVVSRGAAGSFWRTVSDCGYVPGYAVRAVDTTGAGDGFMAGLLAGLLDRDLTVDHAGIQDVLRFANAVGALTTTAHGAIPSLPTREKALFLMASK